MLTKIVGALLARGFLRAVTDDPRRALVFKVTQRGLCYICLLDDTEGAVARREVYQREQLVQIGRDLLAKYSQYTQDCYGMVIVLTDRLEESREKIGEKTPFWLVDVMTQRLVIYEDQPGEFLDARMAIESQFHSTPIRDTLMQLKVLYSPVNIALIALNIVCFIMMEILGSTEDVYFMAQHGALCSLSFAENHEYWTLLTSMFLHFGFAHLFYNMITLLYVGKPVEMIMGHGKYLAVYLLSGIGSGYLSYLWEYRTNIGVNVVSVGASGAICGACGALLYVLIRNRKHIQKIPYVRYLIFFGIITMNGMGDSTINNCAHISGFLLGIFLAGLLYRHPKREDVQKTDFVKR